MKFLLTAFLLLPIYVSLSLLKMKVLEELRETAIYDSYKDKTDLKRSVVLQN